MLIILVLLQDISLMFNDEYRFKYLSIKYLIISASGQKRGKHIEIEKCK